MKGAEKGGGVREGGKGVSFMSCLLGPTIHTDHPKVFWDGWQGFVKYEYGGRIRGALLYSTPKEKREDGMGGRGYE